MTTTKIFMTMAVTAIFFTACSDDDDNGGGNDSAIQTPASYAFERNGQSTVSFGGQTTRIAMGTEMKVALLDNSKTEEMLDGMFAHLEGNADFSDAELNASDKNIRSKIAASRDYFSANTAISNEIKTEFDAWIAEQVQEVFPNWGNAASAGVAGNIQELGGGSTRYVNGKGLELNQAILKGMIGALIADQMLNNYVSTSVLDEASNIDNNNNEVLDGPNNYTTMEHKWDEAFGYLYGAEADPANPVLDADPFLSDYTLKVDQDADFTGIADDIFDAFALGRAAIVANDYSLRDEQAAIIREKVSTVIAVRAVYYLQQGKAKMNVNDQASAFHQLSEGYGFIYSLQFTRQPNSDQPYFSRTEVQGFLDQLMTGNGFWEISTLTLDEISTDIANKFGFSVQAAAN